MAAKQERQPTHQKYRKRSTLPKELHAFCEEVVRRKAMFESDESIVSDLVGRGVAQKTADKLFPNLTIWPAGLEAAGKEIAAGLPIAHSYYVLKTLNDIVEDSESTTEKLAALRLAHIITSKHPLDEIEDIDYNEEA